MRYFFNLAGAVHDPDNAGVELPDMEAARVLSVVHAAEIIRDRPQVVWEGDEVRVEVTDDRGLVLFTVIVAGVNSPALSAPKKP
jgi:hypothetical protein